MKDVRDIDWKRWAAQQQQQQQQEPHQKRQRLKIHWRIEQVAGRGAQLSSCEKIRCRRGRRYPPSRAPAGFIDRRVNLSIICCVCVCVCVCLSVSLYARACVCGCVGVCEWVFRPLEFDCASLALKSRLISEPSWCDRHPRLGGNPVKQDRARRWRCPPNRWRLAAGCVPWIAKKKEEIVSSS